MGAERQQRSVEMALRDVQMLVGGDDPVELDLAVSQLQEALYGLNRRLVSERKSESGPLQGLKNTLGSLKDDLFADDDDDWDRPGGRDRSRREAWDPAPLSRNAYNAAAPYGPPGFDPPAYGPPSYRPQDYGAAPAASFDDDERPTRPSRRLRSTADDPWSED